MVKWFADRTGRFTHRPHYAERELDDICEAMIGSFLRDLHGKVSYPVSTDDLEKLVERHAEDLDLYADLSADGEDVDGVTRFKFGKKPSVAISVGLSEDERRTNRLRTTMTHELGHVALHDQLFQVKLAHTDLFADVEDGRIVCKRERMIDSPVVDWLEWQACYVSGALLMPRSAVTEAVRDVLRDLAAQRSPQGQPDTALVARVMSRFQVSREAARVRLTKLGLLHASPDARTLFA